MNSALLPFKGFVKYFRLHGQLRCLNWYLFNYFSKALCCQRGLLSHFISVLESHQKLSIRSIKQMLRLIQSLGSHSITATELKLLLRLMRDTHGKEVSEIPKFIFVTRQVHQYDSYF